ncbi:prolyl oligopeptidase family serine peptidase [Streptomyces sp. NPDC048825]|uniref:prolyl oligopeptidase family serine peptidase n=1 Tax=Streptomyces sp. NPDC048825 TaxID=3365592 RepID=UPI00371221A4
MAALKLDSSEVFDPVLPAMGFGIAWALVASYLRCRQARNRLGALSPRGPATDVRKGEVEWNDREPAASTAATTATAAESSRQVSHSHDARRAGAAGPPAPGEGPGPVRVPPLVNRPTCEQQQALLDEHAKSSPPHMPLKSRTCRPLREPEPGDRIHTQRHLVRVPHRPRRGPMRWITRRTVLAVTAGAVAAPAVSTATPAAADTTTATSEGRQAASELNPVLRTDLVTRVTPRNNWLVTAVAIQYSHRIDLRGGVIPPSAFQVKATVGGQTAARTVTRVYSNATAEVDDRSHPGRPGDRLIIELDPNDSNARAVGTDPLPLDRAYSVRQVEDVRTPKGEPVLKAGPFASRNDDVINPVVDDFAAGSFTDSAGFELDFRLYQPEGFIRNPRTRTRYPLVVTLHGGGEVADNNMTQLTSNRIAVTFAKPERQRRNPAFVLSPQIPLPRPMDGPDGTDWTDAKVQAALTELIDTFVSEHSRNVDTARLYLVGLSSGGRGIYSLLAKRPDVFAAALPTAGWGDTASMDRITHIPIWADHSVDDPVVPYREGRFGNPGTWTLMNALETAGARVTRGEWANDLPKAQFEPRSRALLRQARATRSHVLFTSYTPGTTPVNPHLSWAQTYENDVVIDWLFDQSR